jgi:hypothetical protein
MHQGATYFARLQVDTLMLWHTVPPQADGVPVPQAAVIERNLRLFQNFSTSECQAVRVARQLVVREWVRRFRITPITNEWKIVSSARLTGRGGSNRTGGAGFNKRKEGGTLEDRKRVREERKEAPPRVDIVDNFGILCAESLVHVVLATDCNAAVQLSALHSVICAD